MQKRYTVQEAANELRVSEKTILREIKRRKLHTERVGRRYFISEESLNNYLKTPQLGFEEAVESFLSSKKSEMVSLLQQLVAVPSVSSELGQEVRLAFYIKQILEKWNIRSIVLSEESAVAVRATYGFSEEALLLDSPLDTLPAGDLAKWKHPPFQGNIDRGRMYGRGTADAKAGIVCMLYAMLFFRRFVNEEKLRLEILFDGGEQDGEFLGLKLALGRGLNVNCGVIGYSGDQKELMIGARGYHRYQFTTYGLSVHTGSRYKGGVNAIKSMIGFINSFEAVKLKDSANPLFSFGNRFTFSKIQGGDAINKVPDTCYAWLDVRTVSEVTKEKIDIEIEKIIKNLKRKNKYFDITTKYLTGQEAFVLSDKDLVVKCLDDAVRTVLRKKPPHIASGPAHVGNLLSRLAVPMVVWGPKGENVHSYNEYVDISSLEQTVKIYIKMIANYFILDDRSIKKQPSYDLEHEDWT